MAKVKEQKDFTEGKILGPLIGFAAPVFCALFLQMLYGAVDLLIVGQFGSAADVSSVSMGSQLVNSFTFIITGVSTGVTVLVGRFIGEKRKDRAGDAIASGIYLFIVIAVLFTVLMLTVNVPLLNLFNTPEEAVEQGSLYVSICGLGMIFIVAYNLFGSVFRGIGDSKTPLITVGIACVVNIAGDLFLVGGFGLRAVGAAIATVFAQAVSVVISLVIVKKRGMPFAFGKQNFKFDIGLIGRILRLGLPLAMQEIVVSTSFLIISSAVNKLGVTVSAGSGVASKLAGFIMLVPSAYGQSLSAFVAQNIGAKRLDRAKRALLHGFWTSFAVAIVMFYISFFHGTLLTRIFTNDPAVMTAAAEGLKAYAMDTILTVILFCMVGFYNGCGKTGVTLAQGLLGVAVRATVAFIIGNSAYASLFLITLSTPISSVVQDVFCVIVYLIIRKGLKKEFDFHFIETQEGD